MEWGKVLLLLLALGISWGSPWCGAQQIKTTSIKKRTFALPSNCSTSCGDISIQYPFGIGHGCYLPGFNLTCRQQYNSSVPARLFMGDGTLEITGITLPSGYVYFKLPVIRMGVDQNSITAPLIDLQNYHNFNFWATNNFLFVHGCNVNASLVDFTNNNTIIYTCSTICLDVSPDLLPFVIRRQHCRIDIPDRVFLGVRLTRLDQTQLQLANATAVSAHMRTSSSIRNLGPRLSWYMDDHSSCTEAMNDMGTYACRSSNSECHNALAGDRKGTVGYYCRCSGATEGNPYLTDGCKDVAPANIYPANNCTRECGSVDIPFPFGLDNESDCYRDSLFKLFCNRTTTPPVLQYQDKTVRQVGVERGELYLMEVRNSSEGLTLTEGHYVYSWLIRYHSCENARMNKSLFACVSEHTTCFNINVSEDHLGYRCGCEKGYAGNPYIVNGCQDINECDNLGKYVCKGICTNTEGSYNCTCQPGTYGDPMIEGCIPRTKKRTLMLALIIAAGNVCLLLLCVMLVILSVTTANRHPANNCTRSCGSVDIPFPFGLDNESDCYIDSSFALFCNQTTTPPVLQYQGQSVTDVDVENGELHIMEMINDSQGHNVTYRYYWFIAYHFCEDAKKNMSLFACVSEHSTCHNKDSSKGNLPGYHCRCEEGYTGNPYVRNGCQGT